MITSLLNQSIYLSRYRGQANDMGDRLYTVPTPQQCRIDFSQSIGRGADGQTYPSIAKIYIEAKVHPQDKLAIRIRDPAPQVEIPGRIDLMLIDRDAAGYTHTNPAGRVDYMGADVDALLQAGWTDEGEYITRNPIAVKNLYDGSGRFHHAEVSI